MPNPHRALRSVLPTMLACHVMETLDRDGFAVVPRQDLQLILANMDAIPESERSEGYRQAVQNILAILHPVL